MGFQCILPSGELIQPGVDVLSKALTAQQANERYRGMSGVCPDCMALRAAQEGTDNLTIQAALSIADLQVRFRCASINDGQRMTRIMHFAHLPGRGEGAGASALCRGGVDLAQHAAAVQVLGSEWANKRWPGCTVTAEMKVIVPGAPPSTIRPDIAIHDSRGNPVACIEYQRSQESYPSFLERDRLRQQQFPEVLWFFAGAVYGNSGNHRDELFRQRRTFYHCWVTDKGQLEYEVGKPRHGYLLTHRDRDLVGCSEAGLVRALEDHKEGKSGRLRETPIDPRMGMQRADGRRDVRAGIPGAMPWIRLAIGDLAEKWSRCEQRWLPGWVVVGIEDREYVVYNGTGKLTKPADEVRLSDSEDAAAVAAKLKWEALHAEL